jgi:hypothetical protein
MAAKDIAAFELEYPTSTCINEDNERLIRLYSGASSRQKQTYVCCELRPFS